MASVHELQELLKPSATTPERVRGLLATGLPISDLSRVTGVTESAVRNWTSGQSEPRPDAAITIDDLRATTKVLLDGGMEPVRSAKWLLSRDGGDLERPIDRIATQPMTVITAAQGEVLEVIDGDDAAAGVVVALGRNGD